MSNNFMRRRISSSLTVFIKILVLLYFAVLIPYWLVQNQNALFEERLFILLFVAALGFFLVHRALSLKHVELTGDGLTISDANPFSRKEIFVPFVEILEARQSFWQRGNFEIVAVEFTRRTKFGKKIVFAPKFRFYAFTEHSVVREINHFAAGVKIF